MTTHADPLDRTRRRPARGLEAPAPAPILEARRRFFPDLAELQPPSGRYRAGTWLIDRSVALLLLVILAPLLALIAIVVKLDGGGPVLFAQERTGLGGRRFRMMKFRTMCLDAEERREALRHLSLVPWPDFKLDRDPRVTRAGRILRRSYLDEIPQLLNVLRGEMSLVGPRPTSMTTDAYLPWHTRRLDARPGMTGLWQVERGGGEGDFDERVRLDIRYLRTRSLRGDLMLLARTVARVGRGGR